MELICVFTDLMGKQVWTMMKHAYLTIKHVDLWDFVPVEFMEKYGTSTWNDDLAVKTSAEHGDLTSQNCDLPPIAGWFLIYIPWIYYEYPILEWFNSHIPWTYPFSDFSNQDLLVSAAFFQRRLEEGCVKGRKMGHITVTGFTPASALEAVFSRFFSAVHRWELPWYLGGLSIKNGDFMGYYYGDLLVTNTFR